MWEKIKDVLAVVIVILFAAMIVGAVVSEGIVAVIALVLGTVGGMWAFIHIINKF